MTTQDTRLVGVVPSADDDLGWAVRHLEAALAEIDPNTDAYAEVRDARCKLLNHLSPESQVLLRKELGE